MFLCVCIYMFMLFVICVYACIYMLVPLYMYTFVYACVCVSLCVYARVDASVVIFMSRVLVYSVAHLLCRVFSCVRVCSVDCLVASMRVDVLTRLVVFCCIFTC